MSLRALAKDCLNAMANMDVGSQARCLLFDRQHHPDLARELEKLLPIEVVALANLVS
jgi:hypothetical protein